MEKLEKLLQGVPNDEPVGDYLRTVYMQLVTKSGFTYLSYKLAILDYVRNPDFIGQSTAGEKERYSRLVNAITGGSVKGVSVDYTWKRFIETLVLINAEMLHITMKTMRGNFKDARIVEGYVRPKEALLKTLNREDEEDLTGSASTMLAKYFQNTRQTAESMEHVLLRMLWTCFHEYTISYEKWLRFSTTYVNNPKNCPALSNRRNDKRHNLQSTIRYTKKITWKRFLEALKAIDVREIECTFNITTSSGNVVEQDILIPLSDIVFRGNNDE